MKHAPPAPELDLDQKGSPTFAGNVLVGERGRQSSFGHTSISGCQANRVLWAHASLVVLQICAGQKVSCNPRRIRSDCLRHHHDRAAWALLGTEPTTLAEIIVELESVAGAELDHGIVGTNPVAVVAFEAI